MTRTSQILGMGLALMVGNSAASARPMSLQEYMALSGPSPSDHIAYGPSPFQYAEYFRPSGPGPFPVAVLIHGGCFMNAFQGMPQLRGMAGALAAKGVAVWSIEYRGLDTPGGGYPGTFLDVRSAIDLLASQGKARHLDTARIVVVGHSAGAALALWAAGRGKLPASSPLYEPNPLPIRQVVALGAFANLRSLVDTSMATCGFAVKQITGSPGSGRRDVFADTNPFDLSPNGSATTFINGDQDAIVPPDQSARDAARLRKRGDDARTIVLPDASHYDEVTVSSRAWSLVEPVILNALKRH